ncbi:SusD/RagB family nutrient-binding outer membrane lipoprotein [Rhizosphaericola mali]|uniref:SusD/RagB family nutrient-binding outer membrane lipoprotein n=1 Tax=Rhizosphaericola mali TaxID=2545455 RepID=A0A5P2G689_9BACT|nr:SusD/RagB family nutrient-binding outer membrane lipoprotein [Rhizosphaericola mali]QES89759.1 SusD/RagB family nutrient-binding outer membrane lipoprotein [Rhizosphaericola mali]
MKIKNILFPTLLTLGIGVSITSCQKGDLTSNPNQGSSVSASLLLNAITSRFAAGGGVINGESGAVAESFWVFPNLTSSAPAKYGQYHVSNYSYYQGTNSYNWSYSATQYDLLKYVIKMEQRAAVENPSTPQANIYAGLAKFFKAYSFIWLAERVGDIPMDQAGDETNLQPSYNTQKEVYSKSLVLLDSANTIIGNIITAQNNGSTVVSSTGDIFGLTYLQWQKVINSYTIRVLLSLSKRADDNADLAIKTKFTTIVNNPTKYPIFTSNSDNMVYKYNSINAFPLFSSPYSQYANIGSTYLKLTTATADPRTFAIATPAPGQITAGKTVADFSAYVGADPTLSLAALNTNSTAGMYSFLNFNRYYTSATGSNCEPYIYIGYPELCFNIAEGINRGWATGDASTWYNTGINASLSLYGLTNGQKFTIGDKAGTTLGSVTIDVNTFLSNVAYKGGSTGLTQILNQKYIAMFENSPMEAYFNWRRTGEPELAQGGVGIGTSDYKIPHRWQYPNYETTENAQNYQSAIQSQFGGTDDVMQDTWLTK